jgi:hypothetical protein
MKSNACIVIKFILVKLVGQLARALYKEHLTMNKQTMYKHIESHRSNEDDMPTITWRILHSNINNDDERKWIEAFDIKKRAGNIINGCIGRTINI